MLLMAIESFSDGMEMVLKGETWGGMRVGGWRWGCTLVKEGFWIGKALGLGDGGGILHLWIE